MLQTLRTYIRPYTEQDIVRISPVFSDPLTMQFWPEPFSRKQVEAWVHKNIARANKDGRARMIVELRDTGEVIGDCGIVRAEINKKIENDLGYIIHHPFWQQGYGTECAIALLEHHTITSLQRVVANMPVHHIGSRRVAEKVGMKLEGMFLNERNRGIETCLYAMEVEENLV